MHPLELGHFYFREKNANSHKPEIFAVIRGAERRRVSEVDARCFLAHLENLEN